MSFICESPTVESTLAIGSVLALELVPAGTLLLSGDLGSGKTVLAQGVATGLGIRSQEVQSPTFTLMREHRGEAGDLVHIDLYRLEPEQVESLGLWEVLGGPGVKVVEWAERLPFEVERAMFVSIVVDPADGTRRLMFDSTESTTLKRRLEGVSKLLG